MGNEIEKMFESFQAELNEKTVFDDAMERFIRELRKVVNTKMFRDFIAKFLKFLGSWRKEGTEYPPEWADKLHNRLVEEFGGVMKELKEWGKMFAPWPDEVHVEEGQTVVAKIDLRYDVWDRSGKKRTRINVPEGSEGIIKSVSMHGSVGIEWKADDVDVEDEMHDEFAEDWNKGVVVTHSDVINTDFFDSLMRKGAYETSYEEFGEGKEQPYKYKMAAILKGVGEVLKKFDEVFASKKMTYSNQYLSKYVQEGLKAANDFMDKIEKLTKKLEKEESIEDEIDVPVDAVEEGVGRHNMSWFNSDLAEIWREVKRTKSVSLREAYQKLRKSFVIINEKAEEGMDTGVVGSAVIKRVQEKAKWIASKTYWEGGTPGEVWDFFIRERETVREVDAKMDKLVNGLKRILEKENLGEAVKIQAKHPGILEIEEGEFMKTPMSHFESLVKKLGVEKGYSKVIRALQNLARWNKKKEPKVSEKAESVMASLKKKFRPEEK